MKGLLLESDRFAGSEVARRLESAGHDVRRCHDAGGPAFPCRGLDGGSCPVDEDGGVDLAVTVRAHPHPRPTVYEDGVSCALRHHVPLVVTGKTVLQPFDGYATEIADTDELVARIDDLAAAPIARHSEEATAEAVRVLDSMGAASDGVAVEGRRRDGALKAEMHLPADTPLRVVELAAIRVAGVLRAIDPHARTVDVTSPATAS